MLVARGRAGALAGVTLLALLPVVAGCGGPGKAAVNGRVVYNNKPLPGGRITFRPADPKQNAVSAVLDAEGKWDAVLPVGEVQVCIDNRELQPPPAHVGGFIPPGLPADIAKTLNKPPTPSEQPSQPIESANKVEKLPGNYVKIPDKYYMVEGSGLHFTVEAGGGTVPDIVLSKN
jgi:hypothetical protein